MIKRQLSRKIKEIAKKMPVVALVGPRQSGKTTLAKHAFPNYKYASLEDLDIRQYAKTDPRGFLTDYCDGAILDEIQHVPELFSYIQTHVDQNDKPGQFILTGSQNFLLLESISQTLAGRISLLTLLPFSTTELANNHYQLSHLEDILFQGLYPRIYKHKIKPTDWYPDYIRTYLERDIRQIKNVHDLSVFHKFLKLCAARTGQLLNLSSLAADCGITHVTARAWISLLETSYIVFLLQPYHNNFGKQLTKSPKLYFYDTGIVCSLLDIENSKQLSTHYIKGYLFETFIISEFVKTFYNSGKTPELYFWRDKSGHEIDCLIKQATYLTPIEIKSSRTIANDFFETLYYWDQLTQMQEQAFLIYGGDTDQKRNIATVLSWHHLSKVFTHSTPPRAPDESADH
ncbi:MAG: AAA family ATPase [Gammaproteobacteria bacterium RIFCSPHIGHO2_02_FULL_42_13]|nr:MAG: AAA family ATPase [Gammaproteobacteria bacterium RIFCSPHIGHO2_02_FULL_42_13]